MERRGKRIREGSIAESGGMCYPHAALFLLAGALALGMLRGPDADGLRRTRIRNRGTRAGGRGAGPRVPMELRLRLRMEARTLVVGVATARR